MSLKFRTSENADTSADSLFPGPAPRELRENKLQSSIVQYFGAVVPAGAAILFAVPNGEYRDKKTAKMLSGPEKDPKLTPDDAYLVPAGQGVLAGAPDLILLTDGGNTTLIEVKAPKERGNKAGVLSHIQKIIHAALGRLGHRVEIVRSVDDFDALLRQKQVPVRAVLIPRAFGLTREV